MSAARQAEPAFRLHRGAWDGRTPKFGKAPPCRQGGASDLHLTNLPHFADGGGNGAGARILCGNDRGLFADVPHFRDGRVGAGPNHSSFIGIHRCQRRVERGPAVGRQAQGRVLQSNAGNILTGPALDGFVELQRGNGHAFRLLRRRDVQTVNVILCRIRCREFLAHGVLREGRSLPHIKLRPSAAIVIRAGQFQPVRQACPVLENHGVGSSLPSQRSCP